MKHLFFLLYNIAVVVVVADAGAASPLSEAYQNANRSFQNNRYQEALALYRKALTDPPAGVRASDIHHRIGDSCFKLGDFQNAIVAYRAALADPGLIDKAQAQYFLGFSCFLAGRDAEAITELLKVPALYPHEKAWAATSYYWAGRASERMGRKDQAAEYYRKAGGNGTSTQGRFAQKKADAVTRSTNTQASNPRY